MKPPSVMFLDIETSGLWKESLSLEDNQQPWACSIAASLCTNDGDFVNFCKFLIKPENRTIQPKAQDIHGISPRSAAQFGIPESRALGVLTDFLKTMPMDSWIRVVSYGEFDKRVISSLLRRFALSQNPPKPATAYDRLWKDRPLVEFIDLMSPFAQQICKIPSGFDDGSYKWPSLDEAAQIILGREPRGQRHDAWQDMLILRDLYIRIREMGMFKEGVAA